MTTTPTTAAEPKTGVEPTGAHSRAVEAVRDPAWVRPALAVLLAATGALYLWGLGSSGWANAYYSAAAQSATQSWSAFFFGSFDAAGAITVDKTPASLWVMGLSARIFGVNSWSLLAPQALMGVATVGALYAAVKRVAGPGAGLLAGAVAALTPVAVLMFRFNNPDALLVLLLTGAAYAMVRALEHASTRWIVLAGALVGFAYLAKMLQAFVVLPVFAVVYLLAAPTGLGRRIGQSLAALVAMIAAAGWWVAIVAVIPADARPYIGGSQTNSILELTLGYNGLGRLTGDEVGSVVPGGAPGAGRWGETGLLRMFSDEVGGQVAWLIPTALLLGAAGLVWTARRPRTDALRASLLLWGGWLVVTGLVFSLMQGIFHAYYAVALAPAIGALVGLGAATAWRRRDLPGDAVLAAAAATAAISGWWLLGRSPDFVAWLRPIVLVAGMAAAVGLLARRRVPAAVIATAATLGVAAGLAGPAAYAIDTASTPHAGSIPLAGPAVAEAGRGGAIGGAMPAGPAPGGAMPAGAMPGGAMPGGAGGLLDASTPGAAITAALQEDAERYDWVAAAVGANSAAGYQLAAGSSVLAIGGFNGSDPSPTLAEFKDLVAAGRIHYFIAGGAGGSGGPGGRGGPGSAGPGLGGSGGSSAITSWVEETFTSTTVDGVTVYDLTADAGAG
jgi:4-amino-4-deoxy-L-arabinose transferase-like glycosyltransferase